MHISLTWRVSYQSAALSLCPQTFQSQWCSRPTVAPPAQLQEEHPISTTPTVITTHHRSNEAWKLLTQLIAHPLQVVQIISHGVGEVHENIQIQGAFVRSEHLHVHHPRLSRQEAHGHQLRIHLGLLNTGVDPHCLSGGDEAQRKVTIWQISIWN